MTTCGALVRAGSPVGDEHECCVDIFHQQLSDNTLPLITTTPQMPAAIKTQDRPVVLYMAPVHKQENKEGTSTTAVGEEFKKVQI